ncbi:SDR family oxidoreductase [Nakamurella sp. PAMC28650]|uniref:SDR family oxidoreductase n=1 Tax=Nakamurella sp. PAMC28650 TaxID=2762325 RepID=UPI001C9B668A|nr:SDR family oxidoreductase [Nakamurella sp. PAMC28650]
MTTTTTTTTTATPVTQRAVAVVTGAARGIGAAVALQLARQDFDLVLVDAPSVDAIAGLGYDLGSQDELQEVAALCRALGAEIHVMAADVRDEAALALAVELVEPGRLHAVVSVAGIIGSDAPAWEFSRADLDRDMDTNFHGVANLARVSVPALLHAPHGRGRFVAIVSTAGETGLPRLAGYVSSKHAALGYIRSLAADLGPLGVTANAVLPGSTRTALLQRSARVYDLPDVDAFAPHQRLARILEPSEIAAAVGWLCSPASSAVTGIALRVDGGFVG